MEPDIRAVEHKQNVSDSHIGIVQLESDYCCLALEFFKGAEIELRKFDAESLRVPPLPLLIWHVRRLSHLRAPDKSPLRAVLGGTFASRYR